MSENPELRENKPIKIPDTLDIIKIDDRWAQITGLGMGRATIMFLDNGEVGTRKLWEYDIKIYWNSALGILLDANQVQITQEERKNLH